MNVYDIHIEKVSFEVIQKRGVVCWENFRKVFFFARNQNVIRVHAEHSIDLLYDESQSQSVVDSVWFHKFED
jgi:hypothetical protein